MTTALKSSTATTAFPVPQGFAVRTMDDGRIVVSFNYDAALVPVFRKLPSAKFDRSQRAWVVSPRYRNALVKVLGEIKGKREIAAANLLEAQKDAMAEAARLRAEAADLLAARKGEFQSNRVRVARGCAFYSFNYDYHAVAVARSLPGAKWDGFDWNFFPETIVDVDLIIAGCNRIHEMVEAARVAKGEALAASREGSEVWLADAAPAVGKPFRHRGKVVVATRHSKGFIQDLDAFSVNGGNSLDEEWCTRVWLRNANAEESSMVEAAEARVKEAEEARFTLRVIEGCMHEEGIVPAMEDVPHDEIDGGEILLEQNRASRSYGCGTTWVLAGDSVWRLDGNGGDGDDWSRNNHGRSIARCMPAYGGTVDGLRRAAALLGR